jgi:hypothetical protein
MTRRASRLQHEFVEFIPQHLTDGILYVSIPYATVVHLCCCGCGNQVVTPLSPIDWRLTFDGETISLSPSIGNWSYPCQSHYWIVRNNVRWAGRMTAQQVAELRHADRLDRKNYFNKTSEATRHDQALEEPHAQNKTSILSRIWRRWFGTRP